MNKIGHVVSLPLAKPVNQTNSHTTVLTRTQPHQGVVIFLGQEVLENDNLLNERFEPCSC